MKNSLTIKPWLVLFGRNKHRRNFATRSQVVKFIALRKGKITGVFYEGKLIRDEFKIYYEGLKLAGLAS